MSFSGSHQGLGELYLWERAPARECWLELLQAFGRRGGLQQLERGGAARWRRAAVRMLWSGLAVLGLLGFEALPHALLHPLENRYPVPPPEAVGRHVGVIVLGGAIEHPGIYQAYGQVPLGQAAERMSVPVGLLRQHAQWQLVFSGGEGRLLATGVSEAELAKAFYEQQGVDMRRVILETALHEWLGLGVYRVTR